ncbi:unnamed protein product [Durusdinium trenchii]|uniref:Uncharacterized protein n=1 Tax=Durusdinium trenchii TaxID=1381693 RepID=A0ABP0SCF0_9DINO
MAHFAQEEDLEDGLTADGEMPDPSTEPEAYAAFVADQEVIEDALEVIKEKKRTLKEARWRQQQVRSGRKFYPSTTGKGYSKGQGKRDDTPQKCLRCGGPHQTSNCPMPRRQQANVTEEAEVAFSVAPVQESLSCEQANVSSEVSENIRVCLSRKMFYPDSSSVNSQRADRVILRNLCVIMLTECKADLINKLQEYGESVSSSMTVLQLKARLAELKESDKESDRQVLKSKIQALNKAAKKKEKMTMETPLVNFGKHAECQYKDILQTHRSYGNWVIDTAAENPGSHWRLCRLAEWLKENWDRPLTQGYQPPARERDSDHTDSSFVKVNQSDSDQDVDRLKAELEQLKSENAMLSKQMERSKSRKEM